jgi:putative endopeptidase
VDRSDLQYTPQTVDAYFNPRRNEVGFAAGVLQPPLFDSLADDASNYGAIGVVIGHELTHAFDEQGRQYDSTAELHDWWVPADDSAFRRRAALLVRQYDEYLVVDSLHINGSRTLSENLADLGGVVLAYRALERKLAGRPRPAVGGFTPEQRFFIAYAQSRRGLFSPAYLRNKVLTNDHSPDEWRVLGPIADMPEFATAFHCRAGDPMIRPDSLRVRMW